MSLAKNKNQKIKIKKKFDNIIQQLRKKFTEQFN